MAPIPKKRTEVIQPSDPFIKIIGLTCDQCTTVSAHRYEDLMQYNWQALWSKAGNCFYAVRHGRKGEKTFIYMHRYIAGDTHAHVDHWDKDTLNNRDENLRPATASQNGANRGIQKTNTSGFKGVSKNGKNGWMAYVNCQGKYYYLGTHRTREGAAKAHDRKAIELFGDFACTNFPRSDYE